MKILIFFLFLPAILFSQKMQSVQLQTPTHQYVIRQAWELLKKEYPTMQNSIMASHIGYSETDGPWTSQKVVAGAYREDEEDLVYGNYGLGGALTTINHFWSADNGDNSTLYFFPSNRHNAYQKAMVFINGSDVNGNRRILIPESGWWPQFTSEYTTGWYFSYESVFDLYNTGKYYWEGYIDINGNSHYTRYGPYYFSQENRDKYVWEILGRAAHLLTDMGVPAHAHNDIHWPDLDEYENTMTTSYAQNWDYNDALNQGGLINVNNKYNPLRYLFYTTNQVADFFPSDDYSGDKNYNSTYNSDYYLELVNILSSLGSSPNTVNVSNIANTSFVTSIRAVAGLLYWFAYETNIIPPPPQPLSVSISGPSYLNGGQTGTWTANASGGKTPYHYSWYYFPLCDDGGIDEPYYPDAPICGYWYSFGSDNKTVSRSDFRSFKLKVDVTDANNSLKTAYKTVNVSSNSSQLAKTNNNESFTTVLPTETKLFDNYPNPFNPTTSIKYQLKEHGYVSIKIYDILGKEVATLVNENKEAGFYNVSFNASNLPSGLYIYRMSVNNFVESKKMLLTK